MKRCGRSRRRRRVRREAGREKRRWEISRRNFASDSARFPRAIAARQCDVVVAPASPPHPTPAPLGSFLVSLSLYFSLSLSLSLILRYYFSLSLLLSHFAPLFFLTLLTFSLLLSFCCSLSRLLRYRANKLIFINSPSPRLYLILTLAFNVDTSLAPSFGLTSSLGSSYTLFPNPLLAHPRDRPISHFLSFRTDCKNHSLLLLTSMRMIQYFFVFEFLLSKNCTVDTWFCSYVLSGKNFD